MLTLILTKTYSPFAVSLDRGSDIEGGKTQLLFFFRTVPKL